MSIREKFNDYKKEIKENFVNDTRALLEMTGRDMYELVSTGYFMRK